MNFSEKEKEKEAVYNVIFSRRDVRGNRFKSDSIPEVVLKRILMAAHHAPSVGFSQPWDFIIITDDKIKKRVKELFEKARKFEATLFSENKRNIYSKLKLEGIVEAPINICITCDHERFGPAVIGKSANQEMDLYSCVCAVQNLWLAARVENIGVGWVSILDHRKLKEILNIPDRITVVAYLCLGYVDSFPDRPELEKIGWLERLNLEDVLHENKW